MSHGEHIRIVGGGRVLHAIDCGDRTVLHLDEGGAGPAVVRRSLLADLTQGGGTVEVVRAPHKVYPPQMVVARAFSRLADPATAAMFATSEHFAAWCVSGQAPRPPLGGVPPPEPPPPAGALEALRGAVEKVVGAAVAAERRVAKAFARAGRKGLRAAGRARAGGDARSGVRKATAGGKRGARKPKPAAPKVKANAPKAARAAPKAKAAAAAARRAVGRSGKGARARGAPAPRAGAARKPTRKR